MKKYPKLRKHTFKNIDNFFKSMTDKPVFHKRFVLPDEFFHLSKTRVSNAPGVAPGYANAQPPGRDKIANAPPPGLTSRANAPR